MIFAQSRLVPAADPQTLRVLSFNIHHGRGMDNQVDLTRIAKVVTDCRADLVALQEVDNRTRRTGGVDQTAELATLTGLAGRFAKAIDFEGGEYGQALLSRWPINSLQIEILPGEPDREKRIIAIGQIEKLGSPLRFCTTHLHHNNAEFRLQQAQAINAKLASPSDNPASIATIIAGDFNAEPASQPIAELLKSWSMAKGASALLTFPSTKPRSQIDYILYRPASSFRVQSIEVIDEPMASDHRPVLAVMELEGH